MKTFMKKIDITCFKSNMNSLEYFYDHERKARKESGKILEGESNSEHSGLLWESASCGGRFPNHLAILQTDRVESHGTHD